MSGEGIQLTVVGAEKRDAGRGVARLPEPARNTLSVLSGDTVLIEGDRATVAKVWPGSTNLADGTIRIDADTRANAGVSIGDQVTVRKQSVSHATRVTIRPPRSLSDADISTVEHAIKRDLRDRPVRKGQRIRIERLASGPFEITDTNPSGSVTISDTTTIHVRSDGTPADESSDRITYEDIGGLDEELELVREMIELPLSEPELFRHVGIDSPKGVLLYGPPGTGKTLIARAVANEVDAAFHHISGPEIMSKYKGESEEQLRERFEEAADNAPSIVFFDEIDSIGSKRGDEADVENRVVAQLLSIMDGLDPRGEVIVIGATNRVDVLDPALRRGGRFDREIEIGVPNAAGRREILEVHTRGMPLAEDVSLDRLAERTHGFVGADIHALSTEAGMRALRRHNEPGADTPLRELRITRDDFETALSSVEPSAMREFVAETPDTGFSDIGGLDDVKEALRETVEWPLSHPDLFEQTHTDPPSGILLYGPPGTGKTLLGRAVARESDANFIHVAGPELLDRYVGESEKAVRRVFDRARQSSPTIVFFDEIDAIASARTADSHEVSERVVSQLLAEMDGLADNPHVIVLAATNRREVLDPAILRPGRFEIQLEVPAPDIPARREILRVHFADKPLESDVDLSTLAADAEGFSGADLAALARESSMQAIREAVSEKGLDTATRDATTISITQAHVDAAVETLRARM